VRASPEAFRARDTIRIADEEIAPGRGYPRRSSVRYAFEARVNTCARSSVRASSRREPGSIAILLNEVCAQRIRRGGGVVEAEQVLTFDGAHHNDVNILTTEVLTALRRLPEVQRETTLMVYAEGYTYAEAAALGVPIGAVMSRLATVCAALAKLK
jgi:DNA-directed RNA polymerase specialized sigma24 family protein